MNQNGRKSLSARLFSARLAAILLLSVGACSTAAVAQGRTATPNFGPNVYIFSPSTPAAQVQSTLLSLSNEAQFSTNRYAVLFMPGTYSVDPNGTGLGQSKLYFRGFQDGFYTMSFDGIPFEDTNTPTHHSWASFPSQWISSTDFDRSPGQAFPVGRRVGGLHHPQLILGRRHTI